MTHRVAPRAETDLDEPNSPKEKTEPGGWKEGDWAYTGLVPGAQTQIPA